MVVEASGLEQRLRGVEVQLAELSVKTDLIYRFNKALIVGIGLIVGVDLLPLLGAV